MQEYSFALWVGGFVLLGVTAKRPLQVNVRLSQADLDLLHRAAERLWPSVPITKSTLLLSLAKMKAGEVLASRPKK